LSRAGCVYFFANECADDCQAKETKRTKLYICPTFAGHLAAPIPLFLVENRTKTLLSQTQDNVNVFRTSELWTRCDPVLDQCVTRLLAPLLPLHRLPHLTRSSLAVFAWTFLSSLL
jgi:hypothetical protein